MEQSEREAFVVWRDRINLDASHDAVALAAWKAGASYALTAINPLTKTKVINTVNKLRNKYPYPAGNGLRFDIELSRAIEAAHGIFPLSATTKPKEQ